MELDHGAPVEDIAFLPSGELCDNGLLEHQDSNLLRLPILHNTPPFLIFMLKKQIAVEVLDLHCVNVKPWT